MESRTFAAEIRNGLLRFRESLGDFEGQHVQVTIAPLKQSSPNGQAVEPDVDMDMDVEKDVYVAMEPPSRTVLPRAEIKQKAGQPCLIVPEDEVDAE